MEHKTIIAIWNADDLPHRLHKLKLFLTMHDIDILLLSEIHIITKHHIKIAKYTICDTKQPSGLCAYGGAAIIIKTNIKYHLIALQATCVSAKIENRVINFAAVYNPSKFKIARNQIKYFFNSLGTKISNGLRLQC